MQKNKYMYIALGGLFLVVWLFFAINSFLSRSSSIESQKNESDLLEISENNVNTINFLFAEFARSLFIGARGVEKNSFDKSDSSLMDFLKSIETEGDFLCVSLDTPIGVTTTSCGYSGAQKTILDRLENTNVFISDVYYDEVYELNVVSVRIPMQYPYEGHYLNGRITTTQLSEIFDKSFFTAGGYYHLVDGNGVYVATANSGVELLMETSFLEALLALNYEEGHSSQQIRDAFSESKSQGIAKYSYNNESRYMYYQPVGINDWVLTTILPKDEIEKVALLHQRSALSLTVNIIAIICIIFIFVFFTEKKARAESRLLQTSIQTLSNKTNKAIIEWDYAKNKLSAVSDYAAIFGRELISIDIRDDISQLEIFCKDDVETVRMVFDAILNGEPIKGIRFRLKHANGEYLWCEYSSTVVRSLKGKPIKSIAFLENIDAEVRENKALKKNAALDMLTNVYNKAHTEMLIKHELEHLHGKTSALFILDFDNFKQLNDTFGHQKGDEVLKETAEGLQSIFRSDDIIGRIGGDEFFIYLKHIESIDAIEHKARTICETLCKTYRKDEKSVTITYSVGIALVPLHGTDFDSLYKSADKALYKVKQEGKDGFKIYGDA